MIVKVFKKIFPAYIRLWPTYYWIAAWTADGDWNSLRVTLRKGKFHSNLVFVFKSGTY